MIEQKSELILQPMSMLESTPFVSKDNRILSLKNKEVQHKSQSRI